MPTQLQEDEGEGLMNSWGLVGVDKRVDKDEEKAPTWSLDEGKIEGPRRWLLKEPKFNSSELLTSKGNVLEEVNKTLAES